MLKVAFGFFVLITLVVIEASAHVDERLRESTDFELNGTLAASCKCEGGYCEEDTKGKLVCKCPPEFGEYASRCKPCNCGKDSNCTISGFWSLTINCICKEGYKVSDSKCIEQCADNCSNGGTCVAKDGEQTKFCNCLQGTSGNFCDVVDACKNENKFCGNEQDTDCIYDINLKKAVCKCRHEDLEFDREFMSCRKPCADNCNNGGTCVAKDGEQIKFCHCLQGTSGNICGEVDACITENKYCGNEQDTDCIYDINLKNAVCKCRNEDLEFDRNSMSCRKTCADNCNNGGMCVAKDSGQTKFCNCLQGTSGDICDEVDACKTENKYCGNEQDTDCIYDIDLKKAVCKCRNEDLEFDRESMSCRIKCTEDSECGEREICSENNGCECKEGLDGEDCKIVLGCEAMKPTCDEAGLECIFDGMESLKAVCKCKEENYVFVKEDKICKLKCNEDTNCGVTQKCSAEKYCMCKEGYEGEGCTIVSGCKDLKAVCGAAGLECVFDGKAKCKCEEENYIFVKEENGCKQSCQRSTDCGERGRCIDKKFCICKEGYEGDGCKVITGCKVLEEKCKRADATCVFNETAVNKASCQCKNENHTYVAILEQCKKNILDCGCQNGGTCLTGGTCSCLQGTRGSKCEDVNCDSINPGCKDSDGVCKYSLKSKTPFCDCPATMVFHNISNRCEDLCQNNPCENEGTCQTYINTFFCICKEKFFGEYCEKSLCTEICGNHSGVECYDDQTSYDRTICRCKDKTENYVKEVKKCINACKSNPCQNGGTCSPDGMSFKCHCETFFAGPACETDNRNMKIVFVGLALVFLVVIFFISNSCFMLKIIQMLKRNSQNSEEWKSRHGVP